MLRGEIGRGKAKDERERTVNKRNNKKVREKNGEEDETEGKHPLNQFRTQLLTGTHEQTPKQSDRKVKVTDDKNLK